MVATLDAHRATGDRGYYSAPAISPNGTDVWLVYNAFTTPFHEDEPRTIGRWSGSSCTLT